MGVSGILGSRTPFYARQTVDNRGNRNMNVITKVPLNQLISKLNPFKLKYG